ncbi:efflux RND transporter periplasmic adaptor subunit [Streptomyces sp. ASQP_92]|uniref:efflux RND transporter periplasmic adaptor subunit n=1 Tax=Streptomyces sp. ASQP_92 TaxID=2979116 RepID=UPI0021BE966E|nr:efflux RND transporter periplasmic adaptor subunit [Streptomyces sp. ASQP_92]MCT9088986.1 efflux RND transporter periplasmic adaptor subunit [Streptomyces sp. ASQP_92]
MRPRTVIAAVVTVAAVAGGGFAVTDLAKTDPKDSGQRARGLPPSTAPIERGDLVNSTSVDGTLGYSRESKLNAGAAGTLTWLAAGGSTVGRDGRLYAVDGKDVRLMYGSEPMYRVLRSGDKGVDVRQLKANLRALGFGGGLADDETFTPGTAAAVERWQRAHGLARSGHVGPEQIAFATGPVRVGSADVAVGDRTGPGQKVMTTTSADRVVQLRLKVSDAALAKDGAKVRVELPNGTTAAGTVSAVGATAKAGDDPSDRTPRIDVTVTFDGPGRITGLDKSPATVKLSGETRKDVLSVPVGALLALDDGSFGVQVVADGKAREVKVTLGMFARGRVEISGAGLRSGLRVGVPST